jgi:TIR domain
LARPGVRGTFSQTGPSHPAASGRLTRTLGRINTPMPTLNDIVQRTDWMLVEDTLTIRSLEPRKHIYFKNVFKGLRVLEAKPSKMQLVLTYTECDDGDYIHVSGENGEVNEFGHIIRWGLYATRWEEWLGMEISQTSLREFSEPEIIAASLRVMAFDGQTQGEVREYWNSAVRRPRVFLSHSSDDKAAVARPLAEALEELGLEVWFDEYELRAGDSLRKSIASGISKSKCAVVVLSKSFFKKAWTERELSGIVAMETSKRIPVIPVWHKVSLRDVATYDPSLADKVGLSTNEYTSDQIALRILDAVRTRTKRRN